MLMVVGRIFIIIGLFLIKCLIYIECFFEDIRNVLVIKKFCFVIDNIGLIMYFID